MPNQEEEITLVFVSYDLDCNNKFLKGVYNNEDIMLSDFPQLREHHPDYWCETIKINKRYDKD